MEADRCLEPTGEALRAALAEICGPDLRQYGERKSAELKTLGFSERPFELNAMTLHFDNIATIWSTRPRAQEAASVGHGVVRDEVQHQASDL